MRLHKHQQHVPIRMNMTPAIDMVFNLLIFFMIVSQVSQYQREAVQLPQVDQALEQERTELMINVRQDGTIIVAGQTKDIAALAGDVQQLLERVNNDPNRVRILIRADERVKSASVNRVVSMLNQKGIQAVRIAVHVP